MYCAISINLVGLANCLNSQKIKLGIWYGDIPTMVTKLYKVVPTNSTCYNL